MCRALTNGWTTAVRKELKSVRNAEKDEEKDARKAWDEKGENRLAQLIQRLGEEERFTDILRVAEDASLRSRLYRKYGL